MPAASDPQQAGPVTFRPFGVRIAALVLGLLLLAVFAGVWLAFPQTVRDQFTTFQRVTVLAFGVAAAVAIYALARSRVEARADGLLVVNGYRSHLYPWDEVAGVTLRAGGPWAILELADGSTAPAMGIQGSDGARAVAQVKQLREVVGTHRQR
ncbi:MAG TPA: PH domain-containing protein [Nocardioidaceae bacterium]|nr:PH domain-containing protein [Nocardioidaceae bacterium]